MGDLLCLHRSWLVADECRSETCADCGEVRLLAQGGPSFDVDLYEPDRSPIGDCEPVTDEAFITIPRMRR